MRMSYLINKRLKLLVYTMYVTSFYSSSYWSNSEYWSQKRTQSGNIQSIILDVHAVKQSALLTLVFDFYFLDYKEG